MQNFLQNLLSDNSTISHKRVLALASFMVLLGMVVIKACGLAIDDTLIYTFAGMTGSYSMMSLADKKIKSNEKNTTGSNSTTDAV